MKEERMQGKEIRQENRALILLFLKATLYH